MRVLRAGIAGCALALAGSAGHAAAVSIQFGDEDCFGLGACAAGDLIDTAAISADAPDPPGTDEFGTLGTTTFDFVFDLTGTTVLSAEVSARTVGLERFTTIFGDGIAGSQFFFNDVFLGTFITPGFDASTGAAAPGNEVADVSFAIAPALLTTGTNTLRIVPEEGFEAFSIFEEYALDFVRLEFITEDTPPPDGVIPLPATALLLAAGLIGLAGLRRR